MRFEAFSFGSIRIDGVTYDHDVVIDYGKIGKRKKKPSKKFREEFGHTPFSVEEAIPWRRRRLVIARNRCPSNHGGGEGRGQTPQDQIADCPSRKLHLG